MYHLLRKEQRVHPKEDTMTNVADHLLKLISPPAKPQVEDARVKVTPTPCESEDRSQPTITFYVLKQGDTFLVADSLGDIHGSEDGLFHNDTRILSGLRMRLGGKPPCLLSAAVSHDNVFFTAHMTNQPLPPLGGTAILEGVIHVERKRLIWCDRLYEQMCFTNFGRIQADLPVSLSFDGDFRDMFEVRGQDRPNRGVLSEPTVQDGCLHFNYTGLDGVQRATWISFSIPPTRLDASHAEWVLSIPEQHHQELFLEVGVERSDPPGRSQYRAAAARAQWEKCNNRRRGARTMASHRLFSEWVEKSQADLALLTTQLPTGPYPYAGIPWFSTPFGRDAVITAMQTLWLDPGLARGVLSFLAHHQAHETSSFSDSAPGKIMHETRKGEMTAMDELPFRQYYGGVDTTPLFVGLAGAYADRTGDLAFIEELWPALTAAMAWVQGTCDSNGDGFLDYARGEKSGLANQGWKDSADSIFHADGTFPEGPISLVEVQGYVYAAYLAMASLCRNRGDQVEARRWQKCAIKLRAAVEDRFWMPEVGFYGVALDGKGDLCKVQTSNPGHLLWCGLPAPDRAARVTEHLLSTSFNTGWGVRTLAHHEEHYNPMSYHNGSVWPHDSALCAAGIARYGDREGAVRLLTDAFGAAVQFRMRLPELFCGFPRRQGEQPIPYPVACLPQAWAAGSVFMLLQACLGLTVDGWTGQILVDRPALPLDINRLVIRRLPVGCHRIDLVFERAGHRVGVFAEGPARALVPILLRS
jgi:glycogen debranching enzyme